MTPLLRFIAVAFFASSTAFLGAAALAAPLDKEACLKLQDERKKLLTREMQAALEHGPDWVKSHLDTGEIEKVREFLSIEEMIEFRCRDGGGIARAMQAAAKNPDGVTLPDRKPTPPPSTVAGSGPVETGDPEISLPDRNPAAAQSTTAAANPSQTVADSDKTAPSKTKATR
jgi:hypothetical protein